MKELLNIYTEFQSLISHYSQPPNDLPQTRKEQVVNLIKKYCVIILIYS